MLGFISIAIYFSKQRTFNHFSFDNQADRRRVSIETNACHHAVVRRVIDRQDVMSSSKVEGWERIALKVL